MNTSKQVSFFCDFAAVNALTDYLSGQYSIFNGIKAGLIWQLSVNEKIDPSQSLEDRKALFQNITGKPPRKRVFLDVEKLNDAKNRLNITEKIISEIEKIYGLLGEDNQGEILTAYCAARLNEHQTPGPLIWITPKYKDSDDFTAYQASKLAFLWEMCLRFLCDPFND